MSISISSEAIRVDDFIDPGIQYLAVDFAATALSLDKADMAPRGAMLINGVLIIGVIYQSDGVLKEYVVSIDPVTWRRTHEPH